MRGEFHGSCDGKVRYESWAQAQRSARGLKKHRGDRAHPYRCGFCRGFHVGR